MKKLFAIIALCASVSWGALGAATRFSINAGATASNVNGGSFDPWGANGKTDYSVSNANTASPVVSSVSYTFAAGDTAYWFMVQAGTSAYKGLSCKITSVSAGAATLNAAIGSCDTVTAGTPGINTVVGIGSASSLTNMTGLIDQSGATAAAVTNTDLGCVGTTCTVAAGITAAMVSNGIHITTTGTGAHFVVGWYKIVSQSAATTFVIDRDPTTGGAGVAGTYYIGGAFSLGSSDDAIFALATGISTATASPTFWVKLGSYTIGGAVTTTSAGNVAQKIRLLSFTSVHGDNPIGLNARPTFAMGANQFSPNATAWIIKGIIFTGTHSTMVNATGAAAEIAYCKFVNKTTTSSAVALVAGAALSIYHDNEAICYRCIAINRNVTAGAAIYNSYIHSSDIGTKDVSATDQTTTSGNIISDFVTSGIADASAIYPPAVRSGNTIIGGVTPRGTCISVTISPASYYVRNNIIYGCVTGFSVSATNSSIMADYNDFFNNTSNRSNVSAGANDLAVNPAFLNVSELSVSGGVTITGNKYYKTGAGFVQNDTNNAFYLVSGTSTTNSVLYPISAVSANGDTITSGMTLTANATADHVIRVMRVIDPTPGARLVQQQNIPGLGTGVSNFPPVGGINKNAWPWIYK